MTKIDSIQSRNVHEAKKYRLMPSLRFTIAVILCVSFFTINLNFFALSVSLPCMVNQTAADEKDSKASMSQCSAGKTPGTGDCDTVPDTAYSYSGLSKFYLTHRWLRNHRSLSNSTGSNVSDGSCGAAFAGNIEGYKGSLEWSNLEQSFIFSGVGWGGALAVFAGGILVDRVGVRFLYIGCLLTFAITAAVTPVVAERSWIGMMALRIVQGVSQSAIGLPGLMYVAGLWFPPTERGRLVSLGITGASMGGLTIFLVGGYFCSSPALGGWQGLMYAVAILTGVSVIPWVFVYSDSVRGSRWVSEAEKHYIESCQGTNGSGGPAKRSLSETPWRKIFTSTPVIGIMIFIFSEYYMYYFISDYMTTYYKTVLFVDVTSSGLLSALPLLVQSVGRLVSGPIADAMEAKVGATNPIRIMTVVSGHCTALSVLGVTFFDCFHTVWAVVFMSMSYFFFGFIVGSFIRSITCIAPLYAGTVTGLAQEFNYLANIVVPYITAVLIGDGSSTGWKHAFYLAAGIGFAGATIFLFLGSGDLQPWSKLAAENRRISIISPLPNIEDVLKKRTQSLRRESVISEMAFY